MKNAIILSLILLSALGCVQKAQTPNATVSVPPVMIVPSCAGGSNSTHYFNGTTFTDGCISNSTLRKYYCVGDELNSATTDCPAGTICQDDGCVNATTPANASAVIPNCVPSNPVLDYYTAGNVTFNGTAYIDHCEGLYDLIKFSCANDSLNQSTYHCPAGDKCGDGVCTQLNRLCTDTDDKNESIPGTTTLYGGGVVISKNSDYCINSSSQLDFSCQGGIVANNTLMCGDGSYCYDAVCMPLCAPLSVPGVLYNGTSYADSCIDNNTLEQFSCSGNSISESQQNCDGACFDNQCLSKSDLSCTRSYNGVKITYQNTLVQQMNNSCLDYQTGKVYACDGNSPVITYPSCSNGQICQSGQCISITQPACYVVSQGPAGDVHYLSSVVVTDNRSVLSTQDNRCLTQGVLVQYYCDGLNVEANFTNCPDDERCQDAVCYYPYTCSITTARSATAAQSVTIFDGTNPVRTEQDLCAGDGVSVHQVSCSEGHIVYNIVPCPNGMKCDSKTGTCR